MVVNFARERVCGFDADASVLCRDAAYAVSPRLRVRLAPALGTMSTARRALLGWLDTWSDDSLAFEILETRRHWVGGEASP